MRAQWADTCSRLLPDGTRIDHRTLEAQGIDRIPTIHEGYAAREIEKRGGLSPLCEENRRIRQTNRLLARLHSELADLRDRLANLMQRLTHGRHHTPEPTPRARTREELVARFKTKTEARRQEQPRPARRARGHASRPQQTPNPMTEARRQLEAARDRAIEQARRAYFDADEMYRHETGRLQDADPPSWPTIRAHTAPMQHAFEQAGKVGILRRRKLRRQAEQTAAERYQSLHEAAPWLRLPDQPPHDIDELHRLENDLRAQATAHDLRHYEDTRAQARERLDQTQNQLITNTDIRELANQIRHEQAKQMNTADTHTAPPRARTTSQPERPEHVDSPFSVDWGIDTNSDPNRHHGMRR